MKSIFELKKEICEVGHKLYAQGMVAANDGNISVKISPREYLCTPTGVSKGALTPDMIIKVDENGKKLEGTLNPSSEIKMHLCCYKEREDVGAVLHAHPPTSTGFAVAHVHMDKYVMIEDVIAIGSVPVTPYGTPSTEEVPNAIRPYLQEHDVVLLENHGALAIGSDLITAYYRMESLELWAKIQLTAHLLGGAKEISKPDIDTLISMRSKYGVTGKHPGYKKYNTEETEQLLERSEQ